jgi:hypothetical protein
MLSETLKNYLAGNRWDWGVCISNMKQAGIARNIGTRDLSDSEPLSEFLHTSVTRAEAFNRQTVSRCFFQLGDLQLKYESRPTLVSNTEKADTSAVTNQSSKIRF